MAKLPGLYAPDGSYYVTQTDGNGNPTGNADVYVFTPLGYSQITSLGSAVTLGSIPTGAKMALISVSSANVRWRDDGTSPTTTVGMPMIAGQEFQYSGDFTKLQFIAVSGSPVLDVSFYK